MLRRYAGIAAIVAGTIAAAVLGGCSSDKPTDFTFLPPVSADAGFAKFIGPGIWEVVPLGGNTHIGTVEYLVEALDGKGKVIASYEGKFKRQQPEVARDNHLLLSELVTILLATERQMKNPVPNGFAANPRYMIPSNAVAVRVTADPKDRIRETDEKNNMFFLKLPAAYRTY